MAAVPAARHLLRAKDLADARYFEPLTVADLAAAARLSPAHFSRRTLFLETDDCQAAYDELSARGVTFNDPPTKQPYGIDTSFRDPSGNNVRLTQVLEFDPARGS